MLIYKRVTDCELLQEGGKMIAINTNKLKAAIYEAGFTVKQLSEAMEIEYNLFSKKINGKSGFTAEQAFALCELLGVSMNTAMDIFLPSGCTKSEPL